jgi:hypothetical protein
MRYHAVLNEENENSHCAPRYESIIMRGIASNDGGSPRLTARTG